MKLHCTSFQYGIETTSTIHGCESAQPKVCRSDIYVDFLNIWLLGLYLENDIVYFQGTYLSQKQHNNKCYAK